MESARPAQAIGAGFVFGLVLIAAGVSSLLERAHVVESINVSQWWPFLLIAVGAAKLRGQPEERRSGWVWLGLGVWGLIVVLTPVSFSETWPSLLIIWGASMVWSGLTERAVGLAEKASDLSENRERSHVN